MQNHRYVKLGPVILLLLALLVAGAEEGMSPDGMTGNESPENQEERQKQQQQQQHGSVLEACAVMMASEGGRKCRCEWRHGFCFGLL
ncbi:hypothetical protein E3N88_20696 [Mikania micrantha]|uniref:Bifunctional inhibitor/plant lipid transfer protein/seed storage helical domain-containing protein n=1 Tax=Mikania micrantha TaxID=192012 RepID=A0A5N6NJL0_9ASTR|nr:hypothetical protein E3N88_20696 [Mikania micrantha]